MSFVVQLGMHWTRIALLAGAAIVVASTLMPWLVGVPPDVLDIGSGTILGITTRHGWVVCAAMAGIVWIALRGPRNVRPTRGALVGVIFATIAALAVASFVLGTSASSIYEDIERAAPDRHTANLAIVALGPKLRELDMGFGGVVIVIGCALVGFAALGGMFVVRPTSAENR